MTPVQIVDESQPITLFRTESGAWHLGYGGVTKIKAYYENGDGAVVPWIAVYKGDNVVVRAAAYRGIIEYESV